MMNTGGMRGKSFGSKKIVANVKHEGGGVVTGQFCLLERGKVE